MDAINGFLVLLLDDVCIVLVQRILERRPEVFGDTRHFHQPVHIVNEHADTAIGILYKRSAGLFHVSEVLFEVLRQVIHRVYRVGGLHQALVELIKGKFAPFLSVVPQFVLFCIGKEYFQKTLKFSASILSGPIQTHSAGIGGLHLGKRITAFTGFLQFFFEPCKRVLGAFQSLFPCVHGIGITVSIKPFLRRIYQVLCGSIGHLDIARQFVYVIVPDLYARILDFLKGIGGYQAGFIFFLLGFFQHFKLLLMLGNLFVQVFGSRFRLLRLGVPRIRSLTFRFFRFRRSRSRPRKVG